jgi:hypothetical protein
MSLLIDGIRPVLPKQLRTLKYPECHKVHNVSQCGIWSAWVSMNVFVTLKVSLIFQLIIPDSSFGSGCPGVVCSLMQVGYRVTASVTPSTRRFGNQSWFPPQQPRPWTMSYPGACKEKYSILLLAVIFGGFTRSLSCGREPPYGTTISKYIHHNLL